MKRKSIEEKAFDLLKGNLSKSEEEEIASDLTQAGIGPEELDSLKHVNELLEDIELPDPSSKLDDRFYAMLEAEKLNKEYTEPAIIRSKRVISFFTWPGLRIAAGISLFLLGWFASGWSGNRPGDNKQVAVLAKEVKGLKETLVLTMMQQSSPVDRIRAVNMVNEFENADKEVIESILSLLNNDSNDNVRLLALETLARYSGLPEVREGLIASISNQKSPLVQIRLAEIMLDLNEKKAVPEFQKVLQNAGLNYGVRSKMNDAIVVLL